MTNVALVTGGTRGIGRAISIALKEQGAQVIANYSGNDKAAALFHQETGILVKKWDVGNEEETTAKLAELAQELGSVDILVNNAGVTRDSMAHKMTTKQWDEVLNTNLRAAFLCARAVLPSMRAKGYGRIVNISSINGQKGQMGQANYSASKAGIIAFTRTLAQENAFKGITVNAVAPGYIATDMVKAMRPDVLKQITAQIPVGRLGEPVDISRCVTFLTAPEAGFITGSVISVNGGQYFAA